MTLELYADTPVIIGQSWSVLSAPYTAGATVLAVVSNTPYPAADPTSSPATVFRVRVDNEILLVTDSRTLSWTVGGAQEGSSAANHAVGALVVVPFTKGSVAGVVAAAAVDATTKVATETSRATAAEATNAAAVTAEATARASADSTLTTNLASETTRASTAEALKVAKAGDTMTGPLVLPGNPSTALQAAPKQYVDTSITNLINGAPGILDTLGEIATQLQSDESVAGALATTVANETTRATTAETGKAQKLTRTAVKTANYTAAAGDLVPCDTTSAAFTVTLPNAPAAGSRVAVKIVTLGAGNAVTIACAGSDVFNKTAGATTGTLTLLNQALQVQYDSGGIWTVVADDIPKSQLDATYVPLLTAKIKTTTYSAAASEFVLADATGGAFTVTLPAPTAGAYVAVKKTDSSVNAVTLASVSGTIDGASTLAIVSQGTVIGLTGDGSNWTVVDGYRSKAALDLAYASLFGPTELASGEANLRRTEVITSSITMTSQTLRLGYITARRTETVTQVRWLVGTAAGATPTLIRVGIYSVAGDGALTLIASTPNDTTLMATPNAAVTKALSASFSKVAGTVYAVGLLVVTAAAAPTVAGHNAQQGIEMSLAPRLAAALTAQADLPGSVVAGGLAAGANLPYFVLLP